MSEILPIGVRYGGSWVTLSNGSEKYRGGRVRLLSVPKNIKFQQLLHMIYDCIEIDQAEFTLQMKTSFTDSETGSVIYVDIVKDSDVTGFLSTIVVTESRRVSPLYVTTERIAADDYGVHCTPPLQPVNPDVQGQTFFSSRGSNQFYQGLDHSAIDVNTIQPSPVHHEYPTFFEGYSLCQYNEDPVHQHFDTQPCMEGEGLDIPLNTIRTPSRNYCDEDTDATTNIGHEPNHRIRSTGYHSNMSGPSTSRNFPAIPPSNSRLIDVLSSSTSDAISAGQIFNSKKELRDTLGIMALRNHFQFKVTKSASDRFEAKCVIEGCKWRIRATSTDANGEYWSVKRIETCHTCRSDQLQPGHRQASSRFIGEFVMDKFQDPSRIYTPNNIRDDIHREFGVVVSYRKAWLAREEARALACGDPSESFQLLPLFCHVLEQRNPGTVTHIHTDDDDHFMYFFMALGPCLRGFISSIRPVIAIDGTFLKGTYRGTMFVAAALDGNNQIYPIAFGVGDSENDASWEWFLIKLRDALGPVTDLVFVSDRHDSIINGIRTVFPDSYHGYCSYHIEGNLKAKYKLKDRKKDVFLAGYYIAAKAYVFSDFEKHMDKLRSIHPDAAAYLENNVGFHRWARCYFPVRRYDIMTTNIAESMNALLKDARTLPIVALADWIRSVLQRWFYERREEAAKFEIDTLTEAAANQITEEDAASRILSVFPVSRFEFEVKGKGQAVVVDLSTRTCQCRRFDLRQLPCAHALAAIQYVRGRYGDYCSMYYKNGTLLTSYAEEIHPVGDQSFWDVPVEIESIVVKPPICRIPAGRPRNQRIPSAGEEVVPRRCSRCKQIGHNRSTCRNPLYHDQTE